jgi:signal transduction histidine kinase/Tfp pilus assembly protein PilF
MIKTRLIIILSLLASGIFAQNLRANGDVLQQSPGDTTSIRLLNGLAFEFYKQNEFDSCRLYASKALNLSENLLASEKVINDPELLGRCKVFKAKSLANIAMGLINSNYLPALDTLQAAFSLMNEVGTKEGQADIYSAIAAVYDFHFQNDLALKNHLLSVELYRETGNVNKLAPELTDLAISQRYLGNYGDALENLIESLKISRQTNDSTTMVETLLAMGFVYLLVEKWDDALKSQNDALLIYENMNDSLGIATVHNDMGVTYMQSGDLNSALKHHQDALKIRLKSKEYYYTFASYTYIGDIYEELANYPEAIRNYEEGLKIAELTGLKASIIDGNISCGIAHFKITDYKEALKNFMTALDLSLETGDNGSESKASMYIAQIYLALHDPQKALLWLQKAEKAAPRSSFKFMSGIYESIAGSYLKLGDYKNAYRNLQLYSQVKDSFTVAENRVKITTLANRLEFENKQELQDEMYSKAMQIKQSEIKRQKIFRNFILFGMLVILAFAVIFYIRFIEKKKLNSILNDALANLKSTQTQLVHAEKMASLGELTAGIAHEIQNPLNFVNNFSEVSVDMVNELDQELEKGNLEEMKAIAGDLRQVLEKISLHGIRASNIVKGMLEHSRSSKGQKELTDINSLADEFLRLAYHRLKAKDNSFNGGFITEFDLSLPKIIVIQQDIGRVLLNLINNAFYAVSERAMRNEKDYKPNVTVVTKKLEGKIEIRVKDNGNGIPDDVIGKIFQPFFTTKPAGQGTGLGLSLSHDIIKAHGGKLKAETKEGEGTSFVISLPIIYNNDI